MKAISDSRRLRVFRVKSARGELISDQGADVWQASDGKIMVSGLWEDLLVPSQEDLMLQAFDAGMSPLELLRMRLLQSSAVRVEITGYAKQV